MKRKAYMEPEALAFVERAAKEMAVQPELELGISRLLELVNDYLGSEAISIFVLDESKDVLVLEYAAGPGSQEIRGIQVPVGLGVVGWTVKYNESLIVPSTDLDPRFYSGIDEQTGFVTRSILCVPLIQAGRARGAIEALNKKSGYFDHQDVMLLEEIAQVVVDHVVKP